MNDKITLFLLEWLQNQSYPEILLSCFWSDQMWFCYFLSSPNFLSATVKAINLWWRLITLIVLIELSLCILILVSLIDTYNIIFILVYTSSIAKTTFLSALLFQGTNTIVIPIYFYIYQFLNRLIFNLISINL